MAFITSNLVSHCFPERVVHSLARQVSVLRAARKLVAADADWTSWRITEQGRGCVFFNHASVQSYALARIVSFGFNRCSEPNELLPKLQDEQHRQLCAPGGAWHRFVEAHCAQRDGDAARVTVLQEEQAAAMAAWTGAFRKRFSAGTGGGKETLSVELTGMAQRARALALENDPDAVRTGLAEIAASLDKLVV